MDFMYKEILDLLPEHVLVTNAENTQVVYMNNVLKNHLSTPADHNKNNNNNEIFTIKEIIHPPEKGAKVRMSMYNSTTKATTLMFVNASVKVNNFNAHILKSSSGTVYDCVVSTRACVWCVGT